MTPAFCNCFAGASKNSGEIFIKNKAKMTIIVVKCAVFA